LENPTWKTENKMGDVIKIVVSETGCENGGWMG
jgi:hypothetical protein